MFTGSNPDFNSTDEDSLPKVQQGVMMLFERHSCDGEPAVGFQVFIVQSSCSP